VILFIALPEADDKSDLGVKVFPLELLPRRCPRRRQDTINGMGNPLHVAEVACGPYLTAITLAYHLGCGGRRRLKRER
jgi:hypothetical protein